jgi:DNA-binding Lrp family transcriptional regulator
MGKEIDAIDARIIEASVKEPQATQRQLAEALKIPLRTVNRRLNKPTVRAKLAVAYDEAIDAAVKIYRAHAPLAAREVVRILRSTASEDRDKIAAVREMNRLLFETKVNVSGNLNLAHQLDLSTLDDEQLAQFEALLAAITGSKGA